MSKTATRTEPTAPATPPPDPAAIVSVVAGLPAEFSDEMAEFAGAGISDRTDDFLLPFLAVAQSGSPQLKRQQQDKFIPGLEAGDIFSTATGRFWRGDQGLLVVPAYYQKAEVEWVLRSKGGGYVATHGPDDPIRSRVQFINDEGKPDKKGRLRITPDGNQLVETAYHFVVVVDTATPAVVALSSTGLQTSRQWNTLMKDAKIRARSGDLVAAPCFARVYRLRTAYRQNDQGDWFVPVVEDLGWANQDQPQNDARAVAKQFFVHAVEHGVQMGRPPVTDAPPDSGPAPIRQDGDEPPI